MAQMSILIVHDDAEFVNRLSEALTQIEPSVEIVNALSGPRAQAMGSRSRAWSRRSPRRRTFPS